MNEKTGMIRVTACGQTREFPAGITFGEIAQSWADVVPHQVFLVKEGGNKLHELGKQAENDCSLEFLTMADKEGRDTYKRSLCFMMVKAFDNVLKGENAHVWIRFTVSGGLFCSLISDKTELTQELLDRVKAEMEHLRDLAIPFQKKNISTDDAISLFRDAGMTDKANLFNCRISSRTNIYSLDGFTDYYYGYMVQNTSELKTVQSTVSVRGLEQKAGDPYSQRPE